MLVFTSSGAIIIGGSALRLLHLNWFECSRSESWHSPRVQAFFCVLQTERIFKRAKKTKFIEDSEDMKRGEHVSLFTYKTIL